MADCNETLRELHTYLDHELDDEARHAIEAHLGGCMDCLQAYDFHAELKMVIAQKCNDDALPDGLLSKLEACFGEDITSG
jgi:mycothiol system anti-sigma-R factor